MLSFACLRAVRPVKMSSTDPNQNGRPPPPFSPVSNVTDVSSSSQAPASNPIYASLPNFAERPQDESNSVSQMLFHTEPLRWHFVRSGQTGRTHLKFSRLFEYMMSEESKQDSTAKTIELLSGNVQSDVTVQALLDNCVDGVPSAKEDAQKYLAKVLANTIKESNTIRPGAKSSPSFDLVNNGSQAWDYFCKFIESTFVSRLLAVQFEVTQRHTICGHQKRIWNWDEQIQVDLDLVDNPNEIYSIKHYLEELLAQRYVINQCTRCDHSQGCAQAAIVSRFPPYLVVYLNRFVPHKDKLTRQVEIDERFELCHQVYQLVSVIIHKGTAKHGVHWTVVRERTDYWVVLANETIYKGLDNARAKELLKRYAFVMMYKRIEDKDTLDDGLNDGIESEFSSTVASNKPNNAQSNGYKFSNKHPYCGLRNLKFVCYSNSILQVLYTCTKVHQYVTHLSTGRFHGLLAELFFQMQAESHKLYPVIDPEFKFNPEFRRIRPEFKKDQMHDAPEYMSILLELVHQEANEAKKNKRPMETPVMSSADQAWDYYLTYEDNSYLSKLFMGQVESVLSCVRCGQSNKTWYPIWQWQLDVDIETHQDGQNNVLNLMHSIDHFSNAHILQDCVRHCSSCQSAQKFSMRQSLHRLPHYLTIHLKRFTATGEKFHRALHILEHLNLLGQSCTLSSVVCHKGSVDIGHYYTIVRQGEQEENQWVKLDDDSICSISSVSAHELLDNFAYLCIYEVAQTKPEKEVKTKGQDK